MADDPWAAFREQTTAAPPAAAPAPADAADPWAAFRDKPAPAPLATSARPNPIPDMGPNTGLEFPGAPVPQAFLDRMAAGEALGEAFKQKQTVIQKIIGINGPREQLWPEVMVRSGASLAHDVLFGEVLTGPGLRKEDFSDNPHAPEPLDELIHRAGDMGGFQIAQTAFAKALVRDGVGRPSRPYTDPNGTVRAEPVADGLPVEQDFKNAAINIRGVKEADAPAPTHKDVATAAAPTQAQAENAPIEIIERLLHELWQKEGLHPAEVAHDAANDAFVRHELTTLPAEPPIKEGHVRLYRGETDTPSERRPLPEWLKEHPDVQATIEATGRWFSADRATAEHYNAQFGAGDGRISYVDVPKADVPKYLSANQPEAAQFSAAGRAGEEFFIPKEMADKRQPVPKNTLTLEETFDHDLIMKGQKEGDIPLRSLGAEATDPPNIPLSQQPASPPGQLMTAVHAAGERLFDMGRDAQMLVAPMARGTGESMALAKDFANTMRKNRWDWSRIDKDISDRFTPEQRKRMWDAADEESVMRQEGKPSEHMGLATLTPEERAGVAELQERAQKAWGRAVDLGMVEGEGLPAYTPRMIVNAVGGATEKGGISLNGVGYNLRTNSSNLLHRKYLTAEETEAAAKRGLGAAAELVRDIRTLPLATARLEDAISGRTLINNIKEIGARVGDDTVIEGNLPAGVDAKQFFSMTEHPAFWTWKPKLEKVSFEDMDGNKITKMQAVKNEAGETIFERVPIFVRNDFEGPLRAVLTEKNGALYSAAMSLKGKTMSLIMNSPLIHNAVEWGRALPAMPGKVATFKVYFEGNRFKNDVAGMHEAIDHGLVPIGNRFFKQDISSILEEPNLTPGRSWTAKVAGAVPDLFDPAAGAATKRGIDKAGDFWHNTLLWDRVGDLQAGLYVNFLNDLVGMGFNRSTSSYMAAHFANRFAGALPQEAMSNGARKIANMFLFSRTFTLGNVGVMKDMLTGLPKDVIAQIEREMGQLNPEAVGYAKSVARRKAIAVVATDIALFYVGNSILQSAINVMWGDSTLDKEAHGYVDRMRSALNNTIEHPLALLQPFNFVQSLSATSENEPNRQDRLFIGYTKDGQAIYARNPAGKIGEEFIGWMTGPLDMMRRKMGTIARPAWQIYSNDKGFGRKIYDPEADSVGKYLQNAANIARHLAEAQAPTGQINAAVDLVKGEGDAKLNALQAFGPVAGLTFSKGAPGGPATGELYHARAQHDYAVQAAMPDIRKQIQTGDLEGARERMTELGIPPGLQRFYIRTTTNPATRLSPRVLRDFYRYSTPEQRERFENQRQR